MKKYLAAILLALCATGAQAENNALKYWVEQGYTIFFVDAEREEDSVIFALHRGGEHQACRIYYESENVDCYEPLPLEAAIYEDRASEDALVIIDYFNQNNCQIYTLSPDYPEQLKVFAAARGLDWIRVTTALDRLTDDGFVVWKSSGDLAEFVPGCL